MTGGKPVVGKRNRDLGEMLKRRRTMLSRADLGLPAQSSRGRGWPTRDEVARLVGISPEWYTRIEQGRASPSPDTLNSIALLFRFSPFDRQLLFAMARVPMPLRGDPPVYIRGGGGREG